MRGFCINYWQVGLYAFIVFMLGFIGKKVKAEICKQKAIECGVVALLHDTLYAQCRRALKCGYISVSDLNNIEQLYTSYRGLNGNGTGTEIYNRVKKLKIIEEVEYGE